MRAKRLSFLLIFVLLSSNAYASGMKGLAVFVLGIYIVPFLIPILSIPFISKLPETIIVLNSFSSVFLSSYFSMPEVLLQVRFPYWEYLDLLSPFL